MTTRKPPGLPWEDYLTRQIREAEAEGAFANLPGAGKPIEGLDGPYDEMWWLKAFLKEITIWRLLRMKRSMSLTFQEALNLPKLLRQPWSS